MERKCFSAEVFLPSFFIAAFLFLFLLLYELTIRLYYYTSENNENVCCDVGEQCENLENP